MRIPQDTIDALHRIVQDTRVAQHDLLAALDRIEAIQWPQRDEALGDVVAMIEPTLWKLSVRLTRIALRAEHAIPPFDHDEYDDGLVESLERARNAYQQ